MSESRSELENVREILSKTRRVKSGDIILPEDINNLVDAVELIVKAIERRPAPLSGKVDAMPLWAIREVLPGQETLIYLLNNILLAVR